METFIQILGIVAAIFASSGFWQYIIFRSQQKSRLKSAEARLLMGIAYSKICDLSATYISRGSISRDEYADLKKYLYDPYVEMGGNGTIARLMREIDNLPIKEG